MTAKEKEHIKTELDNWTLGQTICESKVVYLHIVLDIIDSLPTDPEPQAEPKFSIGAKVRIIANKHGHQFNIGDIVTITSHDKSGSPEWLCKKEGHYSWWISDEEGELVIEEPTPHKPTKISELCENDVIHTETEAEYYRISILLHLAGKKWSSGRTYLELNMWHQYGDKFCLWPSIGQYCNKKFYENHDKNIINSTQITGV